MEYDTKRKVTSRERFLTAMERLISREQCWRRRTSRRSPQMGSRGRRNVSNCSASQESEPVRRSTQTCSERPWHVPNFNETFFVMRIMRLLVVELAAE